MNSAVFFQGFGICAGLIIAIGAQNAFILSQGIRGRHVLTVALLCCLCDVLLISLGLSGVGAFVSSSSALTAATAWAGVVFLSWYGLGALRSAIRGGTLEADTRGSDSLRAVAATTIAVSLLNPHAWLDTVVLLGGISGQYPESQRFVFGAGALSASFVWFFSLAFGARLLAPLFRRPATWRMLDGFVCLTMWGIAASLAHHALSLTA
ncbi:Lysine exporter protein (LYSE/YGGA) [Oleidesulfovibrio alaskensis G20]|jgi:L-lysine exporter family protein LysE/ArgO|uniref:Lysine exporter protein (LYSE/YGGA) n=1 Tax=Oleidesulfovibrio alaskensis (strain ATCC BAA-1058 / DSM 17464 / G20) TaxID=207559 RepID=Q30VM8_OLEA2|nr:LysE/ArgO family amino acid transporter [Oleidesulfovibrio alaskensis]ABB40268.2 Lysine exporter protein (LYSE/YGGA) [Oleidesulfovibrio alaskensis G20]MBG0772785.1 amino acid transporter [Oleidesulfovibrio alaskensis]MBL3583729.1 amino acid transporter [Oleidesulfovibrio alaskensis]